MSIFLSVIIPAYNEEKAIGPTIRSIQKELSKIDKNNEIIVVDDGSTDNTAKIARKIKKIKVISHESNRGYGSAIKTGLRNCSGKYVLIIDADQTYPPEEIHKLIPYIDSYDMVVGARTEDSAATPIIRRPAKFILSKLANFLTNTKIPDLNSGLRIFRKDLAMKFYSLYPNGFSFTITITLASLVNGYSVKYVPIKYRKRVGKSKINPLKDGLNFISLIIRIVTYFNPLKTFLLFSTILFVIAILVFLYSLLFLDRIMDATITILTVSSLQIALFGILADLIVKHSQKFG